MGVGNKNILMILVQSNYDALNSYMYELADVYGKMGYHIDYVDGSKEGFRKPLYELTSANEYLAVISCNVIATCFKELVLKNSVYCCLMFDHPCHHYEMLEMADERVLVIHCDMKGAEYIARYCPNVGSVGFVPLSGKYVRDIVPYRDRKYDIVFTGTNNESGKIYRKLIDSTNDNIIKGVIDNLISVLKENVSLTIQDALAIVLESMGSNLSDNDFHMLMWRLRDVDKYMRSWIREQVVRAIVDAGYKIHIFGNNWDAFECRHPENIIQLKGYGDMSLKALADAKIALNVMPWFRGGFQERIASAMLCGAVSLTDSSTYIEENFEDGVDIALYDGNHPEKIPGIIAGILDNPERGGRIAKAGYDKAHGMHTWKHRAEEILENIMETAKWLNGTDEVKKNDEVKKDDEGKDFNNDNNTVNGRPAVSVIVPVHNSEKTLSGCIGNLVNQTLDDIEIIFVDDCSTDGSPDILNRCLSAYPSKVKVITLGVNRGPGAARNEGLKVAGGKYIGFADSDDLVDETMYEKLYKHAVANDYDVVETAYYREEDDVCILYTDDKWTGKLDDAKRSELIFGAGGYIWSRLFSEKLFKDREHTFRESYILEDMDFMMDVFARAESIGTVKEVLYVYKFYDNSLSRRMEPEFYRNNVMEALTAAYAKLSCLDNYEGVRIAFEAIVYKLYSCVVNQTIKEYCGGKIVSGNPVIKEAVKLKNKLARDSYRDNPYVPRELEQADIQVMDRIEELYG